jgi:glycyl-tRNA synthetase beta subunit
MDGVNPALLIHPAEKELYRVLQIIQKKQKEAIAKGDWYKALTVLIGK